MITYRPSNERGHAIHGWLESRFSFSFAEYYDLKHMGFRNLRVINDDWIDAGQGFGMHPHRDMEIITIVLEGAIQHKDSLGNQAVVRPGEIQSMTAGSGIMHSEFNPSTSEKTHLYQIWIKPTKIGLTPSYGQKPYALPELGQSILLAGPQGTDALIDINADALLHRARSSDDKPASVKLGKGRYGWVQVIAGDGQVNGQPIGPGDGVALSDEPEVKLTGNVNALIFDLG